MRYVRVMYILQVKIGKVYCSQGMFVYTDSISNITCN